MSIIRRLSMSICVVLLASCGSQSGSTPMTTRLPSATVAVVAQTTPTDPSVAPTATPVAAATVTSDNPDALASGLTPEGYHVLGDMAAPITFVDYSDYF